MPFSPVRLNHAVLFVADVDRSVRFYTEVFGMEVVAREPRRRRTVGLYHLAWQLDTVDELAEARRALLDARAYTGESSHGATKSVYGADPDGNEFEIMWMLPRHAWGDYERSAPVDHLDLAGEIDRWSGVRTAGRIMPEPADTAP